MYLTVDTSHVLGIILAGGDATRFMPLSLEESKPACSIGANYKLIDIPLSNLLHSGITRINVAVQRNPETLLFHLRGYENGIAQMRGQFIRALTPPKEEPRFFESDADSLVQLRRPLTSSDFKMVVLTMADQVVKVNYQRLLLAMLDAQADALLVTLRVPTSEASCRLGVVTVDTSGRVTNLDEKPAEPRSLPDDPGHCLANLAMYVMKMSVFTDMISTMTNCAAHQSLSVTGIPWLIEHRNVVAYHLENNTLTDDVAHTVTTPFFDDCGTVEAWYRIQMQSCQRNPPFNFYDQVWPILTAPHWPMSPAKADHLRHLNQALLGWNVICQDATSLERVVLSAGVKVGTGSTLSSSVILNQAQVEAGCSLNRVIIGAGVTVPPNTILDGLTPPDNSMLISQAVEFAKKDLRSVPLKPMVSDDGILVIPSGYVFS